MTQQIGIIMNPYARSQKAARNQEIIKKLGHEFKFYLTDCAGAGTRLARKAVDDGCKVVVAAGGDGTINEVLNGIAGADVHLGIIPIGTINVFAQELAIPDRIEKAWQVILDGKTRKIDVAMANSHRFIQLGGVGLDAEIVQSVTWDMKKTLGPLSYVLSGLRAAFNDPPSLNIRIDDDGEQQASLILIGNGRYYGGPFKIFPDAKLDDGLLDACIFKNQSFLDILRYFQGVLRGVHVDFKDVIYLRAKTIEVKSPQQVPVEVDGEVICNVPVRFSIEPLALNVLVP